LAEDALIDQSGLVGASDKKKFVLDLLDSKIADYKDSWPEGIPHAMALRKQIDQLGVDLKMGKRPGATYEVNINADPSHLLDWDKPLTQQPKAAQEFLAKRDADMWHPSGGDYDANELGQQLYRRLHEMEIRSGKAEPALVKEQKLVAQLNEAGIPGIKYLDGMSRDAKSGLSNYVVFNDKLIDIMRKYGLAGLAPLAGYGAMQQGQEPSPQM
jgi:hypothetical protein